MMRLLDLPASDPTGSERYEPNDSLHRSQDEPPGETRGSAWQTAALRESGLSKCYDSAGAGAERGQAGAGRDCTAHSNARFDGLRPPFSSSVRGENLREVKHSQIVEHVHAPRSRKQTVRRLLAQSGDARKRHASYSATP